MGLEVSRLRPIKMLALDVDGILTNCQIFLDTSGEWRRMFNVRDGYGIARLIASGYQVALITGSVGKDIQERVKTLGIHHLYQGRIEKWSSFEDLMSKTGISASESAYMGDDIFDLPVLEKVGFSATVPEAIDEVKEKVHYITRFGGGQGAVREVCDFIFKYGAFAKGTP